MGAKKTHGEKNVTDSRLLAVVTGTSSGIGRELARRSVMPDQARAATHAQLTKPKGE